MTPLSDDEVQQGLAMGNKLLHEVLVEGSHKAVSAIAIATSLGVLYSTLADANGDRHSDEWLDYLLETFSTTVKELGHNISITRIRKDG